MAVLLKETGLPGKVNEDIYAWNVNLRLSEKGAKGVPLKIL